MAQAEDIAWSIIVETKGDVNVDLLGLREATSTA